MINLEKRHDEIASVCRVASDTEENQDVESALPEENQAVNDSPTENFIE